MSRWLGRALAQMALQEGVPKSPKSPKSGSSGHFGDFGSFGTGPEHDLDERIAIAEIDGGVPAVFAEGFARLQLTPPPGLSVEQWLLAVDDAGRFLDAFGAQAAALGWIADDLFGQHGLVLALKGTAVVSITDRSAALADGRTFRISARRGR